jgi:hypothetical protein
VRGRPQRLVLGGARAYAVGAALLDDSPDTVASTTAGAKYTASTWVRAPAGRSVRLRLRELRGGSIVRASVVTLIGNGSWQRLTVMSAVTSGGTSLNVEIFASLTPGWKAQVDDRVSETELGPENTAHTCAPSTTTDRSRRLGWLS